MPFSVAKEQLRFSKSEEIMPEDYILDKHPGQYNSKDLFVLIILCNFAQNSFPEKSNSHHEL